MNVKAFAAFDAKSPLRPHTIERREPLPTDVVIDIRHCGVCHSDLHQVRDEWGGSQYPIVPGHEIVGRVASVGGSVTKFKAGDTVGVGCWVGSCGKCDACRKGLESYCPNVVGTYNSVDEHGQRTYGGYSKRIVVDQKFVLRVDPSLPLDAVAPLLCAGITTWSPLRHWKVGKGHKLAVLGLGGLGHMAVKFGAALGAEVTLLSGSPSKKKDAQRLGAHDFRLTSDLAPLAERFDFIVDTVSARHDLNAMCNLLARDGTLIMVGASPEPLAIDVFSLIMRRRSIGGSLVGGIPETQEMLDFCAKHKVVSDVETIRMQQIDEAYDRMLKGDVRYRFSIDLETL